MGIHQRLTTLCSGHTKAIVLCIGLLISLATAGGCSNIIRRGQSPDVKEYIDKSTKSSTRYVGDISGVNGLNYAKVEGIGLVAGLNGTGSDPAPSWQKDHLLDEMKLTREIENPNAVLASRDTSIVLVRAMMPPGAKKGDPLDLEVILPPNTETGSLENGILSPVRMKPMAYLGRRVREGKTLAIGMGDVVVDSVFESRQDQANQIRGWIPGGGRVMEDREMSLTLRSEQLGPSLVRDVTNAINLRFTTYGPDGRIGVAEAKTDRVINLAIPENYRFNVGRYIEVVQSIAWGESSTERVNRLQVLDEQIDHPTMCIVAAMRLEAMGKEGVPALRRAMMNPDREVRFHAAQALAYLGESDGIEVLHQSASEVPAFRWNALTALASLTSIEAGNALSSLMNSESAEARYGAFRTIHRRTPNDPMVKGETLPGGFFLHIVPVDGAPMLHVSRLRRPEIVVFGDDQFVSDKLMLVQPGLTIRADETGAIRISKFKVGGDELRAVSTNRVSDFVRQLASVNCTYSQMVSILRELKQKDMLTSRLVVEAVPKPGRSYDRDSLVSNSPVATAKRNIPHDDQAAIERASSEAETKKTTVLSRMKSIFSGTDDLKK